MVAHQFAPGEMAVWRSGSAYATWPPDGERDEGEQLYSRHSAHDLVVFIIAQPTPHGRVVLVDGRLWWCPLESLSVNHRDK